MLRHEWVIGVLLALGFACAPAANAQQESGAGSVVNEETLLAGLTRHRKASSRARAIPGDLLWTLGYEEQIVEQAGPLATMLQQLHAGKVPTPEKAEGAVWKAGLENHVTSATYIAESVGLVRCGVNLPGFAASGDLVWIVRIQEIDLVLHEAWVNSETAEMRWMLPMTAVHKRSLRSENAAPSSSETLFTGPRSFTGHELLAGSSSVRGTGIYGDYLYIFSETFKSSDTGRRQLESGGYSYVLEPLLRSKIQTPEEAEDLALRLRDQLASGSGSKAAQISVLGKPYVVGLFQSLGDSTGFAASLDPIWVVHFISGGDLLGEVTQAGWINAMTGETRWIFPLDMPTTAPPPPETGQ